MCLRERASQTPAVPDRALTVTHTPAVVESKSRFDRAEPSRSCSRDTVARRNSLIHTRGVAGVLFWRRRDSGSTSIAAGQQQCLKTTLFVLQRRKRIGRPRSVCYRLVRLCARKFLRVRLRHIGSPVFRERTLDATDSIARLIAGCLRFLIFT